MFPVVGRRHRGLSAPVSAQDRTTRPGAVWGLPAIAYFAVFALLPMVFVLVLSFTTWNGLGSPQLVGMLNWKRLFSDRDLQYSVQVTSIFALASWLLQTIVAVLLGVWSAGRQRGRAVLSAVFFMPIILSSTAIAITWRVLVDPNYGFASILGPLIGQSDGNIIGSPNGALVMIIVVGAWQYIPFHTLLYQAATRGIPESLYEAARLDGAGRAAQFRYITLPLLRNTAITSSVIMVVGSLTSFETVLILTQGGPGIATRILPYKMFVEGFKNYDMGYGSAIAVVLIAAASVLSLAMVRISGFSRMRSTLEGV